MVNLSWIFLAFLEVSTSGLTCIWFVLSGLVSLIVSVFFDKPFLEWAIFVILGVVLLILTRPILMKFVKPHEEKTNLDRVVGMEGIVTEKITKNEIGEVKVDGKKWSAKSNKTIEVGSTVKIKAIDGVKLIVEKGE